MNEAAKKQQEMDGGPGVAEPFDVQAANPRYKGAWMSDVALALVRPRNPKVAAIIEPRRDALKGI